MNPLVTIILPNYNHSRYLKNRIENILNQTYQHFELVILDDHSTDRSLEIINEYREHSKVKSIILNTENSGSTFKQWVKGFKFASELVWIAESDDLSDLNFLQNCVRVIEEKDSDIVFANSHMIDSEDNIIGNLNWWYNQFSKYNYSIDFTADSIEYIQNALSFNNSIMNASSVVFKFNNNIDISELTNFKLCGDWFFWINYLNYSKKISFISSQLNYYRFHDNSVRATTDKTTIVLYEAMKVRTYCIKKYILTENQKRIIVKEIGVNFKSVAYNLINSLSFYKLFKILYNMFKINSLLTIRVCMNLFLNRKHNANA